jgi:hypothetical protein
VKKWDEYSKNRQRMMDYIVFKAKILTKSSIEIANASLFEILIIIFFPILAFQTAFKKSHTDSFFESGSKSTVEFPFRA